MSQAGPATTQAPTAPEARQELPNVFRIGCPFGDGSVVHVYYIDAPEPALIDTGINRSAAEVIQPALAARGFALEQVRHVFNTHGHWDHMGGNGTVRQIATQARTYVHRGDRHLLDDLEAHLHGYTTYPLRLTGDAAALAAQQDLLRRSITCPTPADVLVEDGQVFTLGGGVRLRAVTTPGHSLGSTSYLLEDAGALFTGDGVQGLGSRPGILPLVFEDSRAYRASIAKVAELAPTALCLGHSFCALRAASGRDPVRRSGDARDFLEDSGEAAKAVEEVMRGRLRADRRAPFLEVARDVLRDLAGPLGVELDADGLNTRVLATLHAFYREQTGAPLPA